MNDDEETHPGPVSPDKPGADSASGGPEAAGSAAADATSRDDADEAAKDSTEDRQRPRSAVGDPLLPPTMPTSPVGDPLLAPTDRRAAGQAGRRAQTSGAPGDDAAVRPAAATGSVFSDPARRPVLIAGAAIVGILVIAVLAWALTRDRGEEAGDAPAATGVGASVDSAVATAPAVATTATTVAPAAVPSAAPPPSTSVVTTPPPTAAAIPGLPTFAVDSTTAAVSTAVAPIPAVATSAPGPGSAATLATTAPDAAPSSAPTASSAPGASAAALVVGSVVPDVAAYAQSLTPAEERAETLALAAAGRHDVAVTGPVRTLCAVVHLSSPIELAGRWERNGSEVQSIGASRVDAPGLGDCLDDDEGDPLAEGTYQFLVVDGDGNESAAGTVVVGAERVEQALVNDGTDAICAVRIAPTGAGYFDAYRFDGEAVVAGATITLALGAVEHDVQVTSCGADAETLATFEFTPDPSRPQSLTGTT